MKKNVFVFLLIFTISLVSSMPSLTFQNEEVQPGETILATIATSGTFEKQIKLDDLKFYEGRKQVPFEFDLKFYEGIYYLYIYANRQGNFSMEISKILYKENGTLESTTITKQFNITEQKIFNETSNTTLTKILQIRPGFVFTTETPIIKLTNKGKMPLNIKYGETEINIQPQETHEIIIIPKQIFSYLNISTYKEFSIPIIYPTANATFVSPSVQLDLRQNPELLFAELFTNVESQKTIELFNFGNESITEIQTTSDFSFVKTENIKNLSSKEIKNLTIIFNPTKSGHLQGNINITYTQYSKRNTLLIPLSLFILPKGSNTTDFKTINETCAKISGTVCEPGFICNGKASFTKNQEYCCLGTCEPNGEEISKSSGFGWIIGIIILIILGVTGYYLYKKQKKIVPKKPEEQIKKTSEKYSKRLRKIIKPESIGDKLTKN